MTCILEDELAGRLRERIHDLTGDLEAIVRVRKAMATEEQKAAKRQAVLQEEVRSLHAHLGLRMKRLAGVFP